MNKYFKLITKSVLALASVMFTVSCNDAWNDHYSVKSDENGSASLGKTIEQMPEAQKFVEALKSTYMFNGTKQLSLTYWDFLNDNQFLTVWLPDPASITDAEWDEYTSTDDNKDHKKVGTEFILNHIARFSHPVGTDTKERIKMMSDKTYSSRGDKGTFDGVGYKENNIRCSNGILHILNGRVVYRPNLYDYITGSYSAKSLIMDSIYDYKSRWGEWLARFTKEELDEERSIQGEINEETGEIEYIDKVILRSNSILKKYGYIDVEDSNYIVVLPSPKIWDSVYDAVSAYYTYDPTDATLAPSADSLQEYWSKSAMITDVFFNRNLQKHIQDSVTSTQFKWSERMTSKYPYHVFQKPYADGGLFDCIDSVKCSNGVVYIKDSWPYSDSVFRRVIKLEAENEILSGEAWKTKKKSAMYSVNDSTLKSARVLEINNSSSTWQAEFLIKNTLSGKYRMKAVFFRNIEEDMKSKVSIKVEYMTFPTVTVLYNPRSGSKTISREIGLTENVPDTIIIGTATAGQDKIFNFPSGNYDNSAGKVRVTISCVKGTNLTQKVWLDCIILEPVFE